MCEQRDSMRSVIRASLCRGFDARGDTATAGRAGALANSEITLAFWPEYFPSCLTSNFASLHGSCTPHSLANIRLKTAYPCPFATCLFRIIANNLQRLATLPGPTRAHATTRQSRRVTPAKHTFILNENG